MKKFIFKDLGQAQQNQDIPDEQAHQQQRFVGSGVALEESVIVQETNAQNIRDKVIKEDISGDDILSNDTYILKEENDLNQIYKISDFVHNNLSNPSK